MTFCKTKRPVSWYGYTLYSFIRSQVVKIIISQGAMTWKSLVVHLLVFYSISSLCELRVLVVVVILTPSPFDRSMEVRRTEGRPQREDAAS
jgi:hypothetical protein